MTLPQHFKNHGYHTQSLGKIYHGGGEAIERSTVVVLRPGIRFCRHSRKYDTRFKTILQGKGLKRSATEAADVPDNTYLDGIVCDAAVQALGKLQQSDRPFFLAVGFRKPHLPFCAPQKYWDLYDRDKISLPVVGPTSGQCSRVGNTAVGKNWKATPRHSHRRSDIN